MKPTRRTMLPLTAGGLFGMTTIGNAEAPEFAFNGQAIKISLFWMREGGWHVIVPEFDGWRPGCTFSYGYVPINEFIEKLSKELGIDKSPA